MSDRYDPPEEQIQKVLRKYTPRQVAIAYLRSSRRARQAEAAFDVMDGIQGATAAAATGDYKSAKDELQKAMRRIKRDKQHHA
ncbi:hypothetical protein [Leisingera sp.]|uniref:hypothetical protein n=1 Tax=Leisingera sp. TaxID=1879318 RepID=UPI002B2735BE|nr:hypothetical protein [Leisingera sp.]